MKRQNFVVLNGTLQGLQERFERVEGKTTRAMLATVVTDHEAYGGHHRVLFPGRLCYELLAFLQAAKSNDLEIMVDGWLRSRENEALVVADRVMFYVGEAVRSEAAERMRQMLAQHAL
jgi:hypothetical protein